MFREFSGSIMNVLFLDIDGVFNSHQWWMKIKRDGLIFDLTSKESFCPICLSNFQYILENIPDINIVITSTWRKYTSLETFNSWFDNKVIGKTTTTFVANRGEEIKHFLETNPQIKNFLILDDDQDMTPFNDHLVKTDPRTGLMLDKAIEVIERFRKFS